MDKAAELAERVEQQDGLNQIILDLMEDIYRWQNAPRRLDWIAGNKEEVGKRILY